jgi:small subunit ribosomal protein S21
MSSESFDLMSQLTREECVLRLRAKTESRWSESLWFAGALSNKPVVGRVGNTSFRIRKRVLSPNVFQPHMNGELLDEDGRTRVRCRFGMHPLVWFLAIWFGLFLIGGCLIAIATIIAVLGGRASDGAWINIMFPAIVLAVSGAFVGFGRLSAHDEPRFLVDFLRDTIDTLEAPLGDGTRFAKDAPQHIGLLEPLLDACSRMEPVPGAVECSLRHPEPHGRPSRGLLQPFQLQQRKGRHTRLLVQVRDNNVDQALRVLKKKMQREGVFREMKQRKYYEKRVREQAEAVRRARKLARKKAQREGLLPKPPVARTGGPGKPGGRPGGPPRGGFGGPR